MKTVLKITIFTIFTLLVIVLCSTVIKIWPENYTDFSAIDEYADRAMQVSYPPQARIWTFLKASIFSPLNGWTGGQARSTD